MSEMVVSGGNEREIAEAKSEEAQESAAAVPASAAGGDRPQPISMSEFQEFIVQVEAEADADLDVVLSKHMGRLPEEAQGMIAMKVASRFFGRVVVMQAALGFRNARSLKVLPKLCQALAVGLEPILTAEAYRAAETAKTLLAAGQSAPPLTNFAAFPATVAGEIGGLWMRAVRKIQSSLVMP